LLVAEEALPLARRSIQLTPEIEHGPPA